MWTFAELMSHILHSAYWFISSYAFGAIIISTGLVWTKTLVGQKLTWKKSTAIYSTGLVFAILCFKEGFMMKLFIPVYDINITTDNIALGLYVYSIFYLVYAIMIIRDLYMGQKNANNVIKKTQLKYILMGTVVALIASGLTTFVIPFFSIPVPGMLDSLGFLIFLVFITYTITKHHLFNIRILTIELVIFALWLTILIRILLSSTPREVLTGAGFLIITVVFGVTLIRSAIHEMHQREKMASLNQELARMYTKDTL